MADNRDFEIVFGLSTKQRLAALLGGLSGCHLILHLPHGLRIRFPIWVYPPAWPFILDAWARLHRMKVRMYSEPES